MNRCSLMPRMDQLNGCIDHRIKDGHDVITRKSKECAYTSFLKSMH